MKKNLLYMLTAAAMLAGCAKNDVVDSEINKEGNLIGFSTYKNISRGNPVDNNNEFLTKDNAFGVTAFIKTGAGETPNASPYMGTTTEGIQIVSDGTKWTYAQTSDQAYWPVNGELLNFYAYSPYGNKAITAKTFATTGLTLNYTVPAEETNQVDLMYAVATNQTKPDNGNSVTMPFKHALTQVHFAIGTSATNLFVDVEENGIQIHNLKNTGTFASSTETWTLNPDVALTEYTVTSPAIEEAGYKVENDAQTFTPIGSADKALMLLPQTLTANAANVENGNYLTISCKIYQKLADGTKIYLKGSKDDYAPVPVGIPERTWERNQKITYNLNIGATGGILDPIEFETEVEEWQAVNGGTIEVK